MGYVTDLKKTYHMLLIHTFYLIKRKIYIATTYSFFLKKKICIRNKRFGDFQTNLRRMSAILCAFFIHMFIYFEIIQ